MPQGVGYNGKENRQKIQMSGFSTERWVAIITLTSLGLLILIRMGFRGVGVPLTNVRVGV